MHPLYHQGSVNAALALADLEKKHPPKPGKSSALTYASLAKMRGIALDKARRWALEGQADGLVRIARADRPGRGMQAMFCLTEAGRTFAKAEAIRLEAKAQAKAAKLKSQSGKAGP